jgi:tRNA(Arg) A34 adenosine deaminase TadA
MAKKRYIVLAKCFDKRGRLISSAYNSYQKSHPMMARIASRLGMPDKQFLHAEILAIIRARGKIIDKITVERYDSFGNPANAMPCKLCMEAIREAGITNVEWTK